MEFLIYVIFGAFFYFCCHILIKNIHVFSNGNVGGEEMSKINMVNYYDSLSNKEKESLKTVVIDCMTCGEITEHISRNWGDAAYQKILKEIENR